MDKYIKQDDARLAICKVECSSTDGRRKYCNPNKPLCNMVCAINELPAEDVAPVRHGHWVWDGDGMDWGIGAWKCSECHSRPNTHWQSDRMNPHISAGSDFCPNCGAKMDE